MLGFYNPSVALTYISLVSASFGLAFVLGGGEKSIFSALICLMISGVCDMFDGAIAQRCRRTQEEELFGVQIDALCDLVAFGALPAVIVLDICQTSLFSKIAATLILLSSVIRLGYFNVQETLRKKEEKRSHYLGLPVTLISIFFPFLLLINLVLKVPVTVWAPLCLVVIAGMEVTPFPLKKPYGKGKIVLLAVGIAVGVGVILCSGRF